MWPRFQRGHTLLLDGKTQNGAAGANAAAAATSRHLDRELRDRPVMKGVVRSRRPILLQHLEQRRPNKCRQYFARAPL